MTLAHNLARLVRLRWTIRAWRLSGACWSLGSWVLDRGLTQRHLDAAAWCMRQAMKTEVLARVLQGEALRTARWHVRVGVERMYAQAEIELRKERSEA